MNLSIITTNVHFVASFVYFVYFWCFGDRKAHFRIIWLYKLILRLSTNQYSVLSNNDKINFQLKSLITFLTQSFSHSLYSFKDLFQMNCSVYIFHVTCSYSERSLIKNPFCKVGICTMPRSRWCQFSLFFIEILDEINWICN